MALANSSQWEVRSTGAATNAGAYNPARVNAGPDLSQADVPSVTYTDLQIDAAVNTHVTSAAHPFTSAAIGNHIRITSGTGFTTGVFEIVSVSGVIATLDRSAGTLASTAGHGSLGGALSSLADLGNHQVPGNIAWVRGSFTFSSAITITPSGTDGQPITYRGYSAVRGDGGQATLQWTGALAATAIAFSSQRVIGENLTFDGNNLASLACLANGDYHIYENCWFKNAGQYGLQTNGFYARVSRCLATGCGGGIGITTGAGFGVNGEGHLFLSCVARGNAQRGWYGVSYPPMLVNCLATGNGLAGYEQGDFASDGPRLLNSTFDANGASGLLLTGAVTLDGLQVENCIFSNNVGYGQQAVAGASTGPDYSAAISAPLAACFINNAYYANTLGATSRVPLGATDITLTADPYTNRLGGDFSLNFAIGGGLALRGLGQPGGYGLVTMPEVSVGHLDVGAVPTSGAGTSDLGTMRNLWRTYTNEPDFIRIPDSMVDIFLQAGLEALNRRVQYFWRSDQSVVLVASTQEYVLPSDILYIEWVEWNGRTLKKSDVERWRSLNIDWRNETPGEPTEWAHYGNRLVMRPTPSVEAVNTSAGLVIRCNATPPSITTNGPLELSTQDWRVAVYRAVSEHAARLPGAPPGVIKRGADFEKMFEDEAALIAPQYTNRRLVR